ncbi:Uma2 family endonuclease [Nonomuraea roseoviolacea]|uniref:Uma2 family endonuclease n=1 Tax=Nonomuraea roseoviolacea subsp. carminata TaxID=160689 RepID=A0ABT1JQY2_9ACTN|nr:Uma2 family endonuclease [Nonomuraea roseoviolacea]MCP2344138.1 Uma2 family endonuclease [Nonomuraea roseoviolacea subsp. carminata]
MLDRLPAGAPRGVELIDGALVWTPPQTASHMLTVRLLEQGFQVPGGLAVAWGMTVTLDCRQRPRADLLIVRRAALTLATRTFFPEDVHLVVEVASEPSIDRDRTTKPAKYAQAGIKHFWRVEEEDDQPVVYTFELEPAVKAYVPTGIHRKRLQTFIGFELDIDLDLKRVIG